MYLRRVRARFTCFLWPVSQRGKSHCSAQPPTSSTYSTMPFFSFEPRRPEPAPEGSQRVPQPPSLPDLPNRMLYGFELRPEFFGPGQIMIHFNDGSSAVFDQPDTPQRADYIFDFVTFGMGLAGSVSIQRVNSLSPPIAYFAEAEKGQGVRSLLNYDDAIPSSAKIQELINTLHLLKEPEWIDTSTWITPEWLERIRAADERIPPLRFFSSGPAA
ncbi:hypothetical protein FB451DRAFT_202261 [Mycena latifolia]|nr:hypothetical protein FB451DRAFT_202261 [Mycena latifolia]